MSSTAQKSMMLPWASTWRTFLADFRFESKRNTHRAARREMDTPLDIFGLLDQRGLDSSRSRNKSSRREHIHFGALAGKGILTTLQSASAKDLVGHCTHDTGRDNSYISNLALGLHESLGSVWIPNKIGTCFHDLGYERHFRFCSGHGLNDGVKVL